MILTGENLTASEALASGLVAKVLPNEQVVDAAIAAGTSHPFHFEKTLTENAARTIASYSSPIIMMAKEAVNRGKQTLHKRRSLLTCL